MAKDRFSASGEQFWVFSLYVEAFFGLRGRQQRIQSEKLARMDPGRGLVIDFEAHFGLTPHLDRFSGVPSSSDPASLCVLSSLSALGELCKHLWNVRNSNNKKRYRPVFGEVVDSWNTFGIVDVVEIYPDIYLSMIICIYLI